MDHKNAGVVAEQPRVIVEQMSSVESKVKDLEAVITHLEGRLQVVLSPQSTAGAPKQEDKMPSVSDLGQRLIVVTVELSTSINRLQMLDERSEV